MTRLFYLLITYTILIIPIEAQFGSVKIEFDDPINEGNKLGVFGTSRYFKEGGYGNLIGIDGLFTLLYELSRVTVKLIEKRN